MLCKEIPAVVFFVSEAFLRVIWTRVANMPCTAIQPMIGHGTTNLAVCRMLHARHDMPIELSGTS
jgi:hypothetical protein